MQVRYRTSKAVENELATGFRGEFGAFLFGLIDALALRLQVPAIPIPHQFLLMLPSLSTIMALLV
ncbi:MAG: hypothetical protein MAG451_00600 [Anaerolineales bacterium]|nr:hypothetical protein [Anaerolineales bacterium]